MNRPALDWNTALVRYAAVCELGGTPAEREWAWGVANQALDTLLHHEHQIRMARDTEELEAA